jgi:hypothetical protein
MPTHLLRCLGRIPIHVTSLQQMASCRPRSFSLCEQSHCGKENTLHNGTNRANNRPKHRYLYYLYTYLPVTFVVTLSRRTQQLIARGTCIFQGTQVLLAPQHRNYLSETAHASISFGQCSEVCHTKPVFLSITHPYAQPKRYQIAWMATNHDER